MSVIKSAVLTTPSRQTVEQTIRDALAFLRAVGKDPTLMVLLGAAGYSDADTERGFSLVRNVFLPAKAPPVTDNPVATAAADIETWRTTGFVILHSALTNLHPEQAAFLFDGLDLENPAAFVLTTSIVLERCSELERGKDRKASHKADLAALATIESRGLTKAERKRLGAAVAIVETRAAPLPGESPANPDEEAERFLALRAWLVDWKNVAKVVVKRRDLLLKLGIGKRRAAKAAPAPSTPVVTPPTPATPVITPAPAPTPAPADETGPESRAA